MAEPLPDTLPRRERERLARRAEMLEAARAVFAEKGYEQATVDEVAERAEFGKGTLYNYFPGGKEAILEALIDDVFDAIEGVIHAHVASPRPIRVVIEALTGDLIRLFDDDRDRFLLVVKEVQRLMATPHDPIAQRVWGRDEALVALLEPHIARAIAEGRLRPFPPEAIAQMLFGNIQGVLMHRFCAPMPEPDALLLTPEAAADFITTVLFDGLQPREA